MTENDDFPDRRRRAYSYLRFSTPEQMEGDSLRRQSTAAADYASRKGLLLDDELTYQDLGVSAFRSSNANVGKLGEFLEAVEVQQVPKGSYLLVESLDRISRDHAFDAQSLLSDMVRKGIIVVTLMDEREYSLEGLRKDPMGMMYSIMGFMRANEESAVKSRRLKQAWENKRAQISTRPLTGRVPAWLRLDKNTNSIVLIPERAAIVRRIFDLTLAGASKQAIATTFNNEGIEPWGAGRLKGERWHRSYIAKVLENAAVIGTVVPHIAEHRDGRKFRVALEAVHDYYPAAVPSEIWAEAQALSSAHGAPRGRQANAPLSNILARLATCPRCDRTMTRVYKGSTTKGGHPSLVCAAAKVKAGCEYKSVRYATVERRLIEVLPGVIRDREGIEANENLDAEIATLQDAIHACRDEVERIVDELLDGPSQALSARLRLQEGQLPDMLRRLMELHEHRDTLAGAVIGSRVARAIKALEPDDAGELDRAEANRALRGLFKRAVINWPRGTIDLDWHVGGTCHVHYGPNLISLGELSS